MTAKTKKNNSAVNPVEVEELPDFAFIGTDGEYYHISRTPHEFVTLLKKIGVSQAEFSYETFDFWLWLHVKAIPSQKHLTLEDVEKLYFQADIDHIMDCIMRRMSECKDSTSNAIQVMITRLGEMQGALNAEQNGDIRPVRQGSQPKK
jgi:hypothetical protein